jgi:antibiotic biosynthesis monooxygenase (ABM) superfamily enzyme
VECFLHPVWSLLGYALLVKKLYANWWTSGHTRSAVVWKMSLIVLCGVFRGSAIIDVLRTCRGLVRNSSIFFFLLFSLGLQVGLPLWVISFVDFLSYFSSSPSLLLYTPCVLRVVPHCAL